MTHTIIEILSWFCFIGGGFLGITGAIGLYRFPDFYTRLHAASITDTLCAGLIISGLALQGASTLMVLKLLLILFILAYTAPTAAHTLAKTARQQDLEPALNKKKGESS